MSFNWYVNNQDAVKVRINTIVTGEPAKWLMEWKRRGLVTSYSDAILQALRLFNEKITEQDLKIAQLSKIKVEDDW